MVNSGSNNNSVRNGNSYSSGTGIVDNNSSK